MDQKLYLSAMQLIDMACAKLDTSRRLILAKRRSPELVKVRQIIFSFLYQKGLSYPTIGMIFSRDHTTIIYGAKKANAKWPEIVDSLVSLQVEGDLLNISKNPYTQGNSKKWKYVYEHYDGKCLACGFSDVVQVHHLRPRSMGGGDEISNLVLLCPNHHALLHLGLVDIKTLYPSNSTYPHP